MVMPGSPSVIETFTSLEGREPPKFSATKIARFQLAYRSERDRSVLIGEPLDPAHQRRKALGERGLLRRLGGGAVDLAGKRARRQREGVAHDARQPLVELVLVGRLLEGLVLGAARPPDAPRARPGIAGEHAVEPFLEL